MKVGLAKIRDEAAVVKALLLDKKNSGDKLEVMLNALQPDVKLCAWLEVHCEQPQRYVSLLACDCA